MKKVPRCCKMGEEMGRWMRCMMKKVWQHLKLAAEVCHSMTYLHTSTINRTSRWHQRHQEFTLQMNHHEDFLVAEVYHLIQYQRTFITNRTSRYFPLTTPFQEFTLQMNHYQDFIEVEDSEVIITAGLIYTYPTYLQCSTFFVCAKSIFYVRIYFKKI